ncbi:MAG TPA: AAA family ATPase [Trebonia sp.]
MVGRAFERAELTAALVDARAGRGRSVLVVGEAGMGKSVLADWVVGQARQAGVRVVRGGCSAAGMAPLWPMRQTLGCLAADWHSGEVADPPSVAGREAAAAAAVHIVAEASRQQPLLIVLEDLHWADVVSLLVLRAIVDAVPGLAVLVLLTSRDDSEPVTVAVHEQLTALPTGVRRIPVPPLDAAQTAALASRVVGRRLSERETGELRSRTGGNPFFVHEVARLVAAHGAAGMLVVPPGVKDVLRRRAARVSQACAALLAVAATVAESSAEIVELGLLQGVFGAEFGSHTDPGCGDRAAVAALLDEAVTARLLEVDSDWPSRYRFRHTLVREVMQQELPASHRGGWHTRIARALERRRDQSYDVASSRLAHHWCRAVGPGAEDRAALWSLRAAREAMAEFGFEAAAGHFVRALAGGETDQLGVSIEHGEALRLHGEIDEAREVLLRAGRAAADAGRPIELAHAALALGGGVAGFEVATGDLEQVELLRRADAVLPDSEIGLRAALRGRLSLASSGLAAELERVDLAESAVRLAREAGDSLIESAVLAAYCDAIAGPDHVSERVAAATRMLKLADGASSGDPQRAATVLLARRLLVVAHLEQGDLAAAEEQALAYERNTHRRELAQHAWLPEIWHGMRALLNGEPDRALRHTDAAELIGQAGGSANAELMVFTVRMQAHLDRGTAGQYTGVIEALLDRIGPAGMPAMYLAAPARALLAAGRSDRAREVLRAFSAGAPGSMPRDAEWLESHWAMVDIALAVEDRQAAEGLFDALRSYEHLWAVDGIGGAVFGRVAEQLGRLAAYLGRREEAREFLVAARESYLDQRVPALTARAETAIQAITDDPVACASRAAPDQPIAGRLRRDGDVWVVEWRGRRSLVSDSKGMRDLAVLLSRPGRAVPAVDLVAAAGGPRVATDAALGPVLDQTARAAYRRRLRELEQEIEDAEADADLGQTSRLRAERSMLLDQLAAATGLHGRVKTAGDPADRARKAVTMRIRAAVKSIGRHDGALARHLLNAVRTGRYCAYEPDVPVTWQCR